MTEYDSSLFMRNFTDKNNLTTGNLLDLYRFVQRLPKDYLRSIQRESQGGKCFLKDIVSQDLPINDILGKSVILLQETINYLVKEKFISEEEDISEYLRLSKQEQRKETGLVKKLLSIVLRRETQPLRIQNEINNPTKKYFIGVGKQNQGSNETFSTKIYSIDEKMYFLFKRLNSFVQDFKYLKISYKDYKTFFEKVLQSVDLDLTSKLEKALDYASGLSDESLTKVNSRGGITLSTYDGEKIFIRFNKDERGISYDVTGLEKYDKYLYQEYERNTLETDGVKIQYVGIKRLRSEEVNKLIKELKKKWIINPFFNLEQIVEELDRKRDLNRLYVYP